MNNVEVYYLLFTDSLIAALILPLNKIFVFKIMLYFNTYNHFFMLILAALGSCIGGIINWYLGKIIISVRLEYHKIEKEFTMPKMVKNIIICLIVLFAWVPLCGSIITIVSGYFKLNLYYLVPSLFISYVSYFCYLIL